ncbi:MAG: signal peptidase II [Chloroflexi bacterium]|nr:signal peptidase II [Chloroflexota bacterium]
MPEASSRPRWLLLLAVAGAVLALDQVSKRAIIATLLPYESAPLLPPLLFITYSYNTGAAFGFLPDAGTLFLILAVVIVVSMIFFYPRIRSNLTRVAAGLVIGGALGNAFDRVQYGHVVDFVHIVVPGIVSNVSNFADHAIVLGVLLITLQNWREERQEKRRKALAAHEDDNVTLPVLPDHGDEQSKN